MKQKATATKSYSKLSDSSPESRLVVGEKEPSNATQEILVKNGDAVAELKSTPPSQLRTRRATESVHAA
jgi:hypothetical protein